MTNDLALRQNEALDNVRLLANIVRGLKDGVFTDGVDFGVIPGTNAKPVLLLPGMEKLLRALRLRPEYHAVSIIEDFDKPLFHYRYECRLIEWETGLCIATAIGSANSTESKWAWRWVDEHSLPTHLNKAELVTRASPQSEFNFAIEKAETSGQYGKPASYWQMWQAAIEDGTARKTTKRTRNGKDLEAWEIGGVQYRIPNPDLLDQINTIDKIAQKRALGSAIKGAANVSEFFSVDLEDFMPYSKPNEDIVDGTFEEVTEPPATPKKPANGKAQSKAGSAYNLGDLKNTLIIKTGLMTAAEFDSAFHEMLVTGAVTGDTTTDEALEILKAYVIAQKRAASGIANGEDIPF